VSARHKRRGDRAARQAKVREVADVLRQYTASPFQFEAPCRHGLRSSLCLNGWPWEAADQEAHKLVQAALDMLGARRPSWQMGQPEWAQEGVRTNEPQHCHRCGKVLPEHNGLRRYCSSVCLSAARIERESRDYKRAKHARQKAWAAAWSAKQPDRRCEHCGGKFKPKDPSKPDQRFCSQPCARRGNVKLRQERRGASV
jgi:hypothetical protein